MIHERRRTDRRRCGLCCLLMRVLLGFVIVVAVYIVAAVANGTFYQRSGTSSGRVPELNGAYRAPAVLGPAELHPVPAFRLPNYFPRHAS